MVTFGPGSVRGSGKYWEGLEEVTTKWHKDIFASDTYTLSIDSICCSQLYLNKAVQGEKRLWTYVLDRINHITFWRQLTPSLSRLFYSAHTKVKYVQGCFVRVSSVIQSQGSRSIFRIFRAISGEHSSNELSIGS